DDAIENVMDEDEHSDTNNDKCKSNKTVDSMNLFDFINTTEVTEQIPVETTSIIEMSSQSSSIDKAAAAQPEPRLENLLDFSDSISLQSVDSNPKPMMELAESKIEPSPSAANNPIVENLLDISLSNLEDKIKTQPKELNDELNDMKGNIELMTSDANT